MVSESKTLGKHWKAGITTSLHGGDVSSFTDFAASVNIL
jgi:hypothetical protein